MDEHERSVQDFFSEQSASWRERYEHETFDAYNYRERARVAIEWLDGEVRPGARLLELGCGAGVQSRVLESRGWSVVATDISAGILAEGAAFGTPPHWVVCSAADLPFRPATFDAILLLGVIGYVPNPEEALKDLRALLRPDGLMIVSWYTHPPYLLTSVSNGLSAPVQWAYEAWRRARGRPIPPVSGQDGFYRAHNRAWAPPDFLETVRACGLEPIRLHSVNFGEIRIVGRRPWGEQGDIRASRAVEQAVRALRLNRLRSLARTHVVALRRAP